MGIGFLPESLHEAGAVQSGAFLADDGERFFDYGFDFRGCVLLNLQMNWKTRRGDPCGHPAFPSEDDGRAQAARSEEAEPLPPQAAPLSKGEGVEGNHEGRPLRGD